MGRPHTGIRTFGRVENILFPRPAARMMMDGEISDEETMGRRFTYFPVFFLSFSEYFYKNRFKGRG
jgi:hypothetical protein